MGEGRDPLGFVQPVLEVENTQSTDGEDVGQLPRQVPTVVFDRQQKKATAPATATIMAEQLGELSFRVSPLKAMVATKSIR